MPRFNVYDIRGKCEHPPLCYDMTNADKLMNSPDIQEKLGVKGRKWVECNTEVHTALLGDWVSDLSSKVATILESGL